MRRRYTISAIAILALLSVVLLIMPKRRGGLSVELVGYTNTPAGNRKTLFVLRNDSSKPVHFMSRPLEFQNGISWMILGPAVDFSTNDVIVTSHNLPAGRCLQFEVNEPTEPFPWRLSLLWWVPYETKWAKVEQFVDTSLRQFKAKPWFARSGILRGPEMPRANSVTPPP